MVEVRILHLGILPIDLSFSAAWAQTPACESELTMMCLLVHVYVLDVFKIRHSKVWWR